MDKFDKEELRKMIKQLEQDVAILLVSFTEKTGLYVSHVSVHPHRIYYLAGEEVNLGYICNVDLD